jgi:hypothetical protein
VTNSTVDGLILSNNSGSTFTFADLDIDNSTSNQRGIFASTSGTINISDGDIDGGSGRGVDIDGTNLGITLASVTSMGGSTAGIDLNTTTGTFEVTGGSDTSVGGDGSGGTISGKTGTDATNNGIGVLLNNATGVTLRRMQLNDCPPALPWPTAPSTGRTELARRMTRAVSALRTFWAAPT